MTEEQSKAYRSCPTGIHFAQHVQVELDHPEARCDDCGGPNMVWWTENDVWNNVIRPNGEIIADPMLCPRCFIIRAKRFGYYGPWCVTHGSAAAT